MHIARAFATSRSNPLSPSSAGFSLKILIAIVLSVLIAHDLVLLLVLRHVHRTTKYQPKISLKTLLGPAAATASSARHTEPRLFLLPPTPPNVPPVTSDGFRLPRLASTVPRLFWLSSSHRIPTALALVIKRVSSRLPSNSLIAGGRSRIHDFKPLFARLGSLGTGLRTTGTKLKISKGATRICSASIEGDKEEDFQDTCVGSPPEEEGEKLDEAQVAPASGRHSHLRFLRHIAAAALLRRFQLKVHDEPSYASIRMCTGHPRVYLERTRTRTPQYPTPAGVRVYTVPPAPLCGVKHRGIGPAGPQILEKYQLGTLNEPFIAPDKSSKVWVSPENKWRSIEEVAEDVKKVEVVEKTVGAAAEVEKVVEVAKKIVTVVQENQVEQVATVEAAEGKKIGVNYSPGEAVEEVERAVKVVEEIMAALNVAAIVSRAQKELKIGKQAEVIADEDNCTPLYGDLDDLPSYEEFLSGDLRRLPAGNPALEPRLVTAESLSTISSPAFPPRGYLGRGVNTRLELSPVLPSDSFTIHPFLRPPHTQTNQTKKRMGMETC
ncbi:hypothetical protein DFH08DRAFT_928996 [Mycena albidolilacea]|uniref:Uncharacterized protein n=1 Tax=Mycena albidolilacea TaxID=1033008 RepID=A0AAD7F559_9AGAR|nr:hypothetical protein DFH08DRAFT_928996 [Mycena albidolilacea]